MSPAILIPACILCETAEQLLYRGARDRPRIKRYSLFLTPAILLHLLRLAIWLAVLRVVPLGIALPLMGLNYVTIALGGRAIFRERVDRRRWAGIALVLAGFLLISTQAIHGQ